MAEHYYFRNGAPFYEIEGGNGCLRAVTLRDVRKVNAVPSVTTVLGVLAKPALEAWKVRQGILAALTLARQPQESDDDYLRRVLQDSQQQAKDAADEGTRIHNAIECYFLGRSIPREYQPHVDATVAELHRLFPGVDDWRPEVSFADPRGFGGKIDLHSPSTGIVTDYKGKDGDFSDGKKLAYDQHFQLAAYRCGQRLPRAPGVNIFVSRTHPGKVASHVWSVSDMDCGADVFFAALRLWQLLKGYDSSFTERPA